MEIFEFRRVHQTEKMFKKILALRYKVYCEERGFEKPEDHPEGLETDEFDACSIHIAAIEKGTQNVVGTMRMIPANSKGFPIENHFKFDVNTAGIDKPQIFEVSRMAISKGFCLKLLRMRAFEKENGQKVRNTKELDIIMELIKGLVVESRRHGVAYWYAVMARSLHLLLKRKNIVFNRIGPDVEYHGLRAPYLAHVEDAICGNDVLSPLYSYQEGMRRVA